MGENHPDWDDDDSCWQCDGEGYLFSCIDGCCLDADIGCDLCERTCDICEGSGVLRRTALASKASE